jgi:hypothetical protein
VRLEPLLEAISAFLDDQRDVIECIRRDLVRGLKQPGGGRRRQSVPHSQTCLVSMALNFCGAKPTDLCEPSQNGWLALRPQAHHQ